MFAPPPFSSSGFANTQEAYDAAFDSLFDGLEKVENILSEKRYLTGDRLTEADIRLWTTLVRFDAVYVVHFKCNKQRLMDYPNLWGFTREIYQIPGISETIDIESTKMHYFMSHVSVNPKQIVPKGFDIDYLKPHGRGG